MNTLLQKLQSAKIRYFADPINYGGQYFENRFYLLLKSEYNFFKPYIRAKREDKNKKLIEELDAINDPILRQKIFLWDGAYSVIVPDKIINNKKSLNKFFRAQDKIIGPEVEYSTGKYLYLEGDETQRLDIFGDKIETANFKFFARNIKWIGGSKFFVRYISCESEKQGYYENISIYDKKARASILADFEENGYDSDVANLFEDEELNYAGGLVFVQDLDDNEEIIDKIRDWHSDYMEDCVEGDPCIYDEKNQFSAVKYSDPIRLVMNQNE